MGFSDYLNIEVRELDEDAIIVFSPHPDDEVLGCGGVIHQLALKNTQITLVFVTTGEAGIPCLEQEQAKAVRHSEAVAAAKKLGVSESDLVFLEYGDGALAEVSEQMLKKCVALLGLYSATAVFLPHRADGHEDHNAVGRAVFEAVGQSGISVVLYEYPIWLWFRYPFVHVRSSTPGRIRDWLTVPWSMLKLGRAGLNCRVDISAVVKQKEAALKCYESQLTRRYCEEEVTLRELGQGTFLKRFFGKWEFYRRTEVRKRY